MNWIPIEQKLPEIDQIVWLYKEYTHTAWVGGRTEDDSNNDIVWFWGNTYGSFWHNGKTWAGDIEVDHFYQPTHWMPLPELPAKEEA